MLEGASVIGAVLAGALVCGFVGNVLGAVVGAGADGAVVVGNGAVVGDGVVTLYV